MAKTNLNNSRQTASLAFDDEDPAPNIRPTARSRMRDVAPAAADQRSRGRAAEPGPGEAPLYNNDERPLLTRRRPLVRQGVWPQAAPGFRWSRFLFRTRVGLVLLAMAITAAGILSVLAYRRLQALIDNDPHFRIASSSSIQVLGGPGDSDAGAGGLTRTDLLGVFASDIGRNIFFVPLARRQQQLQGLPWVAHATVMRLLPDRLSIAVVERSPVAFVRLSSHIGLVDAQGVLLSLPPAVLAARHYSFPVVTGLTPGDTPAAVQARAERMALYQRFIAELDDPGASRSAADGPANGASASQGSSQPGATISSELSEVDLSDPEDVRALVPAAGSDILLHFGDSQFLPRFRSYQAHLAEWRRQYPHLSAIDLRYDRQVVLKMADGAESEAASTDGPTNTLAAAPSTTAPHLQVPHLTVPGSQGSHDAARLAHHPAGHGTAHGWRPQ